MKPSRVLLAMALTLLVTASCGKAGSPTSASPQSPPASASLVIVVAGALYTLDGAIHEATILLDGVEITSAHTSCNFSGGCISLLLNPLTDMGVPVATGQHTISFQVLRHASAGKVTYTATGTAVVGRGQTAVQAFTLPERQGTLGVRESITYQITVTG